MAKYYVSLLLVRLLLPAGLLFSIALRPFGLSLIYLLLYLIAPFPHVPDAKTFKSFRGRFLLLPVIVSLFLLLVHIAWHCSLAGFLPYGSILTENPLILDIGKNLGLVAYYNIEPLMAIHYLAPELVMSFISIFVYITVKKLVMGSERTEMRDHKFQRYPLLTTAGRYVSLFLIMFSGIMRPSVTSAIYFLVFMGAATAWSLGKPLEKGFAVIQRLLMAIMSCHMIVLLAYQWTMLMDMYPSDEPFARYFGLTKLVELSDNSFKYEVVDNFKWVNLASPLAILFTYYFLGIESRELFKPKVSYQYIDSKERRDSPTETSPLIRNMSPSKRLSSFRSNGSKQLQQDSMGSVLVPDNESMEDADQPPTLVDNILDAIVDFFRVLVRSSYIATTVTMMAWSIMFHSWLAFVFLMWGNIVWLCHNQRSFMLKTSPILVVYAMFLLITQYLYAMDLTEDELPSNFDSVNLRQIGLSRPIQEACIPLLIKSLFTCMFWVTLRQRVQEIKERHQSAVVADMAAPLQLTMSTAASVVDTKREEEHRSRLLKIFGDWLRSMCARYWIYVVVIMMFVIGITGERMTIFKIIYMFLFVSFILMFQFSWYMWRKLMYVFWVVVIIYSMVYLILLYIYQFDNFSRIIADYLFINVKLQHDLGLASYNPADLFVKLLTPTLFLIMTIMQVHYFHKDFMKLSEIAMTSESPARGAGSSRPSQGASTMNNDMTGLPSEDTRPPSPGGQSEKSTEHDLSSNLEHDKSKASNIKLSRQRSYAHTLTGEVPSLTFRHVAVNVYETGKVIMLLCIDKIFLYLEMHLVKIILIALMLLCVLNVCVLHVPIMLIIAPACLMTPSKQRLFMLILSTIISAYLMVKMVYQIDYINHRSFDVNCTQVAENGTINTTVLNDAAWLGFRKTSKGKSLAALLQGYIAMIAMFTFNSLIGYRQQRKRSVDYGTLKKINEEKLMFPSIKREDADKDLIHCIKYFFNYGFYKFGVEVTLICLMGVIGSRMDVYAVMYSMWLLIFVAFNREKQAKYWGVFTVFVTFIIPIQYILAVGPMPMLCNSFEYPWKGNSEQMKHIRTWFFLPYSETPPHATKLIFDFFLLLFAARQLRVFRIEKSIGERYPGGSNSEHIGKEWETLNFVNPVPDFLGYVGSWLDVLKRSVFLGMLWVTLAIMFLTGTNRVNLFSIGYLVGSFIFLWQGTDLYLRPKSTILLWWSWLLRYNVIVVLVKSLLQIPGCLFSTFMQEHACWLVQLLGIGCVDKFAGGNISHFIRMNYTKMATCSVPQEDIGLAWDGVCFAFLILQRRLFYSYYFYRVIDESKATTILASRGAELIEELRQKQMKMQEGQEVKILEKIKVKMERIKANQKKIQGTLVKEPINHDRGSRSGITYRPPASHQKAVRSGDYYMFDEFDDTEPPLKDEESESEDEEGPTEMGLGKIRRRLSRPEIRAAPQEPSLPPRDEDLSLEEDVTQAVQETIPDKIRRYIETAWAFISSILVSLTRHVMKYSRDYRYVSRTLSVEKKVLKESDGFGIGVRDGSQMIWEPLPETIANQQAKDLSTLEDQDDSLFRQEKNPFVHLGYALWYAIIAHTDIVCYIMVFINQIQSATILSIPLPLMVFLWGTLTIPRPTKTFWVTLIAYTEVIVLIKSMFQFEILPWNQKAIPANMPFTAPRIIGIERKSNYALYDLLLLLIIFLHRFMLKSLGLWKESVVEAEIRDDIDFPLTAEDTELIVKGNSQEVGRKYLQLAEHTAPEQRQQLSTLSAVTLAAQQADDEQAGTSKQGDDDHFKVDDDKEPIISVKTTFEEPYRNYPQVLMLSGKRYLRPMHMFFTRMLEPGARVTADVYAYMFLCDFFNFLVVIFGFAAFGTHQGDGGVQAYLEENKVPIPFLVMLILQFALIVIDRALYLRKFILGKILFQYALIIGVHIWMFFVLPFITERTFNAVLPPPMWYMMKCLYLLLSAYQIRCGYPRRIIGNFLCKSYRFINMIFFRGFMVVPFVFELRTLMDWIWTDTSMTLMDWLKMEDIFASVFLLKCSRYMEDEFPSPRGAKKSTTTKYLVGGSVLAFVIAIIWFPLVFFAFGNTVGQPNPPTDVTVKIRIGPYLPVYQMSAQSHNIITYTESDYASLSNLYARDRTAQTFLSNYMHADVAVVKINPNSTLKWIISPPELDRLVEEAATDEPLNVKFSFIITHPTNSGQNPPTIEDSREMALEARGLDGKWNPEREKLLQLLAGNASDTTWVNVKLLFPKFLKVFNKGTAKPAYQLSPETTSKNPDVRLYRDVQLRLERDNDAMYWRVRERCDKTDTSLNNIPLNNCNMLVLYTFNDKLFPETLNFISGSGIIGLYTTFVFLASRVLRGFFSGIYTKIMFDDLPNVDRVLQLCLDIYLVREALELTLEEDLFAKLVFLYRSPETMIKWSRPREEENEEQRALPPPPPSR